MYTCCPLLEWYDGAHYIQTTTTTPWRERQMNQPDFVRDTRAHGHNLNVHKFTVISDWIKRPWQTQNGNRVGPIASGKLRIIDRTDLSRQFQHRSPSRVHIGLLATKKPTPTPSIDKKKTSPAASTIHRRKKEICSVCYLYFSASKRKIDFQTNNRM